MAMLLKVYDNGDHTCLIWCPEDENSIAQCRGFGIKRILNGSTTYLHGFTGFTDDSSPISSDTVPDNCIKFPIQRFLWWDYLVKPGDKVQYSVIPVTGPDRNHLALDNAQASPLTDLMTITPQCSPHMTAYFTKGIIAAQWVSRALAQEPKGQALKDLVAKPGDPLRNALSGLARPAVLDLLAKAKSAGGPIYAALYELNDPELIQALVSLGQNCNLILANGAFKPPANDENAAVRQQIKGKVSLTNRMVSKGHFGHNKFVVFCDPQGKAQSVLSGSLNWTSTGLCTQANNSIVIEDDQVAGDYLEYWQRIKQAGNGYPASYIQANSSANTYTVDGCKVTPWCVPTKNAQDLDFARGLINSAKQGILFLFFNPGVFEPANQPEKWTLLQNIMSRRTNSNLYIRGVVNQEIPNLTEVGGGKTAGKAKAPPPVDPAAASPVSLIDNQTIQPLSHDVIVPAAIKQQFHEFQAEKLGASLVNVHSKVVVLDPFGANPVVITGSHNLGYRASSANDDNMVVIQGNAALAAAYAVNIIAIFDTYRWNSYVQQRTSDPKVWHGPVDNDGWQDSYLTGQSLAELDFWLGRSGTPPARAPAAPAKASTNAPLKQARARKAKARGR